MSRRTGPGRLLLGVLFGLISGLSVCLDGAQASPETEEVTRLGRQLYLRHCSQCHGAEGQGFRKLYPPLQGSPYFSRLRARLPCLIRRGLQGTIRLADGRFNQTMPANPGLGAAELTALLRYSGRFAGRAAQTPGSEEEIRAWLERCP
ncbi:c-type cytochrome [Desulfogranum mediterraneum]|uniref:c-type cytochrome n=1 Tax=Desulfogranum mediterraneum TaxID=160661 RepID=UPI0003F6A4E1|nr:cytochrome c [Desulfogranum mediterraneum]